MYLLHGHQKHSLLRWVRRSLGESTCQGLQVPYGECLLQGCCSLRKQNMVGRDRGLVVTWALQIDRRRHLELQLQRQVQRDLTLVQQSHAPGQASPSVLPQHGMLCASKSKP